MDWIDKNHLDTFAGRKDARDLLPALIYDLILATSETPVHARFLSGEAGQVRGFDGVLMSRGADPFVPAGHSVWEFGCEPDFKSKAAEDLTKRTKALDAAQRAQTTFVFVTPRTYDTPRVRLDQWEAELAKGKGWKDVRVVDGGKLKHWLGLAPGVAAHWASGFFGAYPPGVASTDELWREYASGCSLTITEQLLLAGRADQAASIVQRLSTLQPDRIEIAADSAEEALAFAIAALRLAKPEVRAVLHARALGLRTPEAVTELVRRGDLATGLIFFPTNNAATRAGLLVQHGPTIIASGRAQGHGGSYVQLTRPPRHVFAEALSLGGSVDHLLAAQLAAGCGSSVTVLTRVRPGGTSNRPAWADNAQGTGLIAALLAGAWDASVEGDRSVLATLSDASSYEEFEARIQHLLAMDDPPLERAGTVWKVRAPMDAFVLLGALADGLHLGRFRASCCDVLGERDTNLELDDDALLMAGRGLNRSAWLREGMAMTLVLAATMHEPAAFGASLAAVGGPEAWVGGMLESLPGLATDAALLASLRGALPLLAEAAPAPFVAAVARLLDGGAGAVAPLFRERTAFITPDARHTYLLWALEVLAWDPNLLPRVAILLARLAAFDPGGKLGNRPINSLREILLPWLPHTDAPVAKRLAVMQAVVRTDDKVGWDLSLRLLPEMHSTSSPTSRPKIREAGANEAGAPTTETIAVHRAAAQAALRLVGTSRSRWLELIPRLPDLPREEHEEAVSILDTALAALPSVDRQQVWDCLRATTARHAGFQDTAWALRGAPLERLVSLVQKWEPEDVVARTLPLFAESLPELIIAPGESPLTRERLEELRAGAVRDLLTAEGEAGVLRLADELTNTWDLVRVTGNALPTAKAILAFCLSALARGTPRAAGLAGGLSSVGERHFGDEWRTLLRTEQSVLSSTDLAVLLQGLPDDEAAWDFVASLGKDVDDTYWKQKSPWLLPDSNPALVERAVQKLLNVGRAIPALLAQARSLPISSDLTLRALDGAIPEINASGESIGTSFVYAVEQVFERLRARSDVDRADIARREFAYLSLLTSAGKPKQRLVLFETMAGNPELFVSLINTVFFPASGERPEPNETLRQQARAAFRALEAFREVPGRVGTEVDAPALRVWVTEALRLTIEADRAKIGAQYIGKVLAHAPHDPSDEAWPHRAVREVIEEVASDELERGVQVERFNMRGVFSKDPYEGGGAERALAVQARQWADVSTAWPRTAGMLARIAESWEHHAEREDIEAQQRFMEG
ncbi:hypothetical protein EJV46_01175 [Roseococcus sp. SYP-B2431]|uniref:hypothetical protein n=1 Tax=Roseococcus sp. SYP-B2431 TaxID=2496640 RepID=UPI00103E5F07|nr:hypothetical protein [Roseococcus sp. SYP-B2431]TCI00729.1 hypothetical protein EJV46_01175 [Roseococcus sp. SYP-B2431]